MQILTKPPQTPQPKPSTDFTAHPQHDILRADVSDQRNWSIANYQNLCLFQFVVEGLEGEEEGDPSLASLRPRQWLTGPHSSYLVSS